MKQVRIKKETMDLIKYGNEHSFKFWSLKNNDIEEGEKIEGILPNCDCKFNKYVWQCTEHPINSNVILKVAKKGKSTLSKKFNENKKDLKKLEEILDNEEKLKMKYKERVVRETNKRIIRICWDKNLPLNIDLEIYEWDMVK